MTQRKKKSREITKRKQVRSNCDKAPVKYSEENANNNNEFECSILSSVSTPSKLYASGINNYWTWELGKLTRKHPGPGKETTLLCCQRTEGRKRIPVFQVNTLSSLPHRAWVGSRQAASWWRAGGGWDWDMPSPRRTGKKRHFSIMQAPQALRILANNW